VLTQQVAKVYPWLPKGFGPSNFASRRSAPGKFLGWFSAGTSSAGAGQGCFREPLAGAARSCRPQACKRGLGLKGVVWYYLALEGIDTERRLGSSAWCAPFQNDQLTTHCRIVFCRGKVCAQHDGFWFKSVPRGFIRVQGSHRLILE